jgi:hypothetical protein
LSQQSVFVWIGRGFFGFSPVDNRHADAFLFRDNAALHTCTFNQ